MPLPMSRRIELLRTKWFNLLIHSSRQMERLPIVNERIGLAWNGEQAIELPKEPQQEGSRLSHPCYDHFSCQFPTLVPFSIELKRS